MGIINIMIQGAIFPFLWQPSLPHSLLANGSISHGSILLLIKVAECMSYASYAFYSMSWVKTGCFFSVFWGASWTFRNYFCFILFSEIPFLHYRRKWYVGWNPALGRYVNSGYFHQRNRDTGNSECIKYALREHASFSSMRFLHQSSWISLLTHFPLFVSWISLHQEFCDGTNTFDF